jgi:hypothetical protein
VYERRGRWYYTVDIKDPATGKWRKVWSHAFDRQADAWTGRVEALDRVHQVGSVTPGGSPSTDATWPRCVDR